MVSEWKKVKIYLYFAYKGGKVTVLLWPSGFRVTTALRLYPGDHKIQKMTVWDWNMFMRKQFIHSLLFSWLNIFLLMFFFLIWSFKHLKILSTSIQCVSAVLCVDDDGMVPVHSRVIIRLKTELIHILSILLIIQQLDLSLTFSIWSLQGFRCL